MFATLAELRDATLIRMLALAADPQRRILVISDDEDWVVIGNAGPFTCT
jgi:hypothetical protein